MVAGLGTAWHIGRSCWWGLGARDCCGSTSSASTPGLWCWRASLILCNSVLGVPSTEGSKILLLFITNNFIIVRVNTVFLRQTTGTPALVCHLLGCSVALLGTVLAVPVAHLPCPLPSAGERVPYTRPELLTQSLPEEPMRAGHGMSPCPSIAPKQPKAIWDVSIWCVNWLSPNKPKPTQNTPVHFHAPRG